MQIKSLLLLLVVVLALQGCETLKGAREGFARDIQRYQQKEDPLHKADAWMREHMW